MRLSATRLTSIAQAGGQRTLIQRAIAVLRRFGLDAHIYLPGVGMLNGLQAGNYLDSAGTTVGTVDQPVGLVLDAAGSLGVELVTNGGFDSSFSGWTDASVAPATAGFLAGAAVVTSTGATYGAFRQTLPTVIGNLYRVLFTTSNHVGNLEFRVGTTVGGTQTLSASVLAAQSGEKQFIFTATGTSTHVQFYIGSAGGSVTVDNISVREVTGIAASQPTTSNKCILRRGAVNLLTYSGDFSNAAWTKASGATISATGITDYLGGASAVTVAVPSSAGGGLTQVISTWSVGSNGTGFVYAKRASTGSATAVRLTTNNQVAWNTGVSTKLVLTTQWQIIPLSGVLSTTANCKMLIGCSDAAGAIDGDCIGNVDVCFAGLFQGTYTAAQIQALGGIPLTTTAPASTALGPQYWSFDGSNDSLALGGPLFQMADDHCVVAGAMCNAATGTAQIVASLSRDSSTGNSAARLQFDPSGTVSAAWTPTSGSAIITAPGNLTGSVKVLAAHKVGNVKRLRVGGVTAGTDSVVQTDTGMNSAAISDYRVGLQLPFNGAVYPIIGIKGTVPDADLLLLEKFVANLSGVTL